jgi:hypothetical protein
MSRLSITPPQGLPTIALAWTPWGYGFPAHLAGWRVGDPQTMRTVLPASLDLDTCVLLPAVGGSSETLPPLVLWWILLFGLSLFTRYESARWTAALELRHPLAVPLEALLDEALEAVPQRILAALHEPFGAW